MAHISSFRYSLPKKSKAKPALFLGELKHAAQSGAQFGSQNNFFP